MSDPVTVTERSGGKYTLDVSNGRHHLYADEPLSLGSSDLGPTPFEYLCASLGSCTAITLRMYADRKDWPVETISVTVKHAYRQSEASDRLSVFTRQVFMTGPLEESQTSRLIEIANKCPVHRLLETGNHIETRLG